MRDLEVLNVVSFDLRLQRAEELQDRDDDLAKTAKGDPFPAYASCIHFRTGAWPIPSIVPPDCEEA